MEEIVFPKLLVVGIGGATNSGKSSLAERLVNLFPGSSSVCQDSYFMDPGDARLDHLRVPELDCWNWENIEAIDMERMVKDVQTMVELPDKKCSCPMLFIEGFLIYNYEHVRLTFYNIPSIKQDFSSNIPDVTKNRPLSKFFDRKFFLTMQEEECRQRRKSRSYDPPDGPQYFDKIVWPEYLKLFEEIKLQTDISFIDGTKNQDDIFSQVLQEVKQLLNTCTT